MVDNLVGNIMQVQNSDLQNETTNTELQYIQRICLFNGQSRSHKRVCVCVGGYTHNHSLT